MATMGLGALGTPASTAHPHRIRWFLEVFEQESGNIVAPQARILIDSRPSLTFYASNTYTKPTWQEYSVTYPDMDNDESAALILYWLRKQEEAKKLTPLTVVLRSYNGVGELVEKWEMSRGFVYAYNYQCSMLNTNSLELQFKYISLDYSNDEDTDTNCPADPKKWLQPLHGLPAGDVDAWAAAWGAPPPGPPATPDDLTS